MRFVYDNQYHCRNMLIIECYIILIGFYLLLSDPQSWTSAFFSQKNPRNFQEKLSLVIPKINSISITSLFNFSSKYAITLLVPNLLFIPWWYLPVILYIWISRTVLYAFYVYLLCDSGGHNFHVSAFSFLFMLCWVFRL